MPDIHESSYNAWMGRKKTTLRRPTLDCGCPNNGEVSFHLWCDRLACQEHADAPHDCGEFKGSKSGIEEEAVEPDAVVEAPAPRPLRLSPETYRALYGDEPLPAAAIAELVEPAPFVLRRRSPEDRQAYLAQQRAERVAAGASAEWLEMFDGLAAAPLVAELVEPDPATRTGVPILEPPPSTSLYCAGCGRDITYSGVCSRCPEPPWAAEMRALMARDTRPWWRRYLPGGTR